MSCLIKSFPISMLYFFIFKKSREKKERKKERKKEEDEKE